MKKVIKYLQGGEYHEATVADVGDLDLLKTESKTDLVSAINEIFATGGSGSKIPDGYGELVEKVEVINNESHENTQAISDAVKEIEEAKRKLAETAIEIENTRQQGLLDAQKAAQKAVDDYDNARKKLDEELAKAQQQLSKDIAAKQTSIEELNNKASTLNNQLSKVKESSELTAKNLAEATLDLGKTRKQITNLENEVSQKLSNTDLDPLKEKVASVDTEVKQTREELAAKANKKDLDLLTGTVNDVNSRLTVATDRIESKVSRDTLEKNISDFQVKKANLLSGTRDWLDSSVNDNALARVSSETYSHARIAILDNGGSITLVGRNLTVGESYTLSVNASVSEYHEGTFPVINVSSIGTMKTVDTKDEKVTTNWQRYFINFVASGTEVELTLTPVNLGNGIALRLNKPKLEKGIVPYPWEQNEDDDYDRIEHTEARLTVYDDRITGITKRQSEYWDKQIELQTTVAQVAEGVSANMNLLETTKDGLIKEFDGKLSATAKNLTTEYSERTNEAIGQLTDSGVNLILNSSFANTDNNLNKWQEVSSKANIIADNNGLNWLSLKQSGLTSRSPIAAKTNYFPVKKGKMTVAVDVKVNIPPDENKVLVVEFYDTSNHRVDFKEFTLADMGLNSSGGTKGRGLVRVGIDRNDVSKATVKAQLLKNGDLQFTNFLAKNSSIDDGAYTPNPEDTSEQFIKQNTKIEQNAKAIEAKASSTDVSNKLLDLDGKLRQEITTQKDAILKVTSDGIEQVTHKVETAQNSANNAQNSANRAQSTADSVNASLGAFQKVTESSIKNMGDRIESSVSSTKKMVDDMQIGGTNLVPLTNQGTKDWYVKNQGGSSQFYEEEYYGARGIHIKNNTVAKDWFVIEKKVNIDKFKPDTDYMISFNMRVDTSIKTGIVIDIRRGDARNTITVGNLVYDLDFTAGRIYKVQKKIHTASSFEKEDQVLYINSMDLSRIKNINIWDLKIEEGTKATPWSPAPEDIQSQINGNKQAIESANSKITQVENGFNATAERVRSDLDGEIVKNSNDIKAFDDKYSRELTSVKADLNTKATQSWAQNKIEETANSVTRTIETVKNSVTNIGNAVSTLGSPNLVINGGDPQNLSHWSGWTRVATHPYYYNGNKKLFELETNKEQEIGASSSRFKLKRNTNYSISFIGFASANVRSIDVFILGRKNNETQDYTGIIQPIDNKGLSAMKAEYVTTTFNSGENDEAYIRFDNNGSTNGSPSSLFIADIMVNEGASRQYSPNPNDTFENLSVGGRNYLQGSLDFTWRGGIIRNGGNTKANIVNSDDNVGKMVHVTGNQYNGGIYTAFSAAFPNGEIQAGEEYTLSFDAKGNGTFSFVGNESGERNQIDGVPLTNSWKRYSVSGKINTLGRPYVIYFKPNFDVYIRRVKIEKGNKATDYTQASEDIQGQIDTNKQAIEVNKHRLEETDQKLESQFQTIKNYGNRITASESKLQQTSDNVNISVSNLQNSINNITVGGTNLIKQSQLGSNYKHDDWIAIVGGVTWNSDTVELLSASDKNLAELKQTIYDIEPDTDYVFSFDLNYADSDHLDKQGFIFWEFKDNDVKHTTNVYKDNWTDMTRFPNTPGRKDKKLVIHTQPDTHAIIFMVRSLKGATQPFKISKIKFEKGNKPTDWSPAPQDVDSQFNGVNNTLKDYRSEINVLKDGISLRASEIQKVSDNIGKLNISNLVYNSEFVNNAEGWSNIGMNPAGTILYADNEWDNWYGSAGLAFRNPNKQDYLVSESKRFKINSGQVFSASVQLHVTDNITKGNCRAGMEIKFYANEKDAEIATSNQQTQFMYNIWNEQQKLLYCNNVSVPSGAKYAAMRLYTYGVGNVIFNQPMLVSDGAIRPYKQDTKTLGDLSDKFAKLQVKTDSIEGIVANKADISIVNQKADQWNVRVANLQNDMQGQINNRVEKNRVVTEINADTSGVKINANKLEINGDTKINGDLQVPNVRLVGKSGMIGLDGNSGIIISSANTAFQTRITRLGMDFLTTTNGEKEVMGGITTGANAENSNLNGISIVIDTKQKLGDIYGGDYFSLGATEKYTDPVNRVWTPAMVYDASQQLFGGGFKWNEKSRLSGWGRQTYIDDAHDPLMWRAMKFSDSTQQGFFQPTLSLGWNDNLTGDSGVSFLWNSIKPYGTVDMTGTKIRINEADGELRFAWVNWSDWTGKIPALIRDASGGPAGIGIGWDGNVILFGRGRRKALSEM